MLITPRIAPVGSPDGLRNSGSAWNARERKLDEPTSSSLFFVSFISSREDRGYGHHFAQGSKTLGPPDAEALADLGAGSMADVRDYRRVRHRHGAAAGDSARGRDLRQRPDDARASVLPGGR